MSQKMNENHLHGLTDQEVIASRQKYGENLLTPPKRPSIWKLYLEKFLWLQVSDSTLNMMPTRSSTF